LAPPFPILPGKRKSNNPSKFWLVPTNKRAGNKKGKNSRKTQRQIIKKEEAIARKKAARIIFFCLHPTGYKNCAITVIKFFYPLFQVPPRSFSQIG
jgi:hypothetical protein